MKNIVIAVAGHSPQIITETLYGLIVERHLKIDSVYVITTVQGARAIDSLILKGNKIYQLYNDYELPIEYLPIFKPIIIKDENGVELDDIRSPKENKLAAQCIINIIRDKTTDPETALHCSLAGGRKTMSAYMALAMNLFGREQDSLSHVLINPPELEGKDFFYPLPGDSESRIELTEIPFIRLRSQLEKYFGSMQDLEFDDLLRLTNTGIADWLQETRANLIVDQRVLEVEWGNHVYSVKLSPKLFVIFYFLFLENEPQQLLANSKFEKFFKKHYDSERQTTLEIDGLQKSISELNKDYLESQLPQFLLPFIKVTTDTNSNPTRHYIPLKFENRQVTK